MSATQTSTPINEIPHITFKDRANSVVHYGLPVIPLLPRTKKAFMDDWPKLASSDPAQIEKWNTTNPNYNLGVVAKGQLGGVWFFEYDSKDVAERIFKETGKKLPPTFHVQSRNERGHLYFRMNQRAIDAGNFPQGYVKGGDWSGRISNAYVVGPLSVHPITGLPYQIKSDAPVVEAPDWFFDWMETQRVSKATPETVERDSNGHIPHGYIHDVLVNVCTTLTKVGLPPQGVEDALVAFAEANCAPPLDLDHVRQVARSTDNWNRGNPLENLIYVGGRIAGTDLHLEDEPDEKKRLRKVFDEGVKLINTNEPRIVILNTIANLRKVEHLSPGFPQSLTKKSLWGLLGDFVEIVYPTVVASREMILFQALPALGVVAGKTLYVPFGADRHYSTVWTLNIAKTADGKGSVKNAVLSALEVTDSYLHRNGIKTNINSGEALARVACGTGMANSMTRLIWVMPEMAMLFNSMHREGSNLSYMLREAYDANQLENLRSEAKKSYSASNYLLGMMGTTTPAELRQTMPAIDWHNGRANRFLWNVGAKTKKLSTSRNVPRFEDWALRLHNVLALNNQYKAEQNIVDYSADGLDCWNAWIESLDDEDEDTLLGLSQARIKPNCLRTALLYAQLDEERLEGGPLLIEPQHIEAAVEIVNRSAESTAYYLNLGNNKSAASDSDIHRIYEEIAKKSREGGKPELTRTEITRLFRKLNDEQKDAVCLAANLHLETRPNPTGGAGAPVDVWCVNRG